MVPLNTSLSDLGHHGQKALNYKNIKIYMDEGME